jgi:hypothetical protein
LGYTYQELLDLFRRHLEDPLGLLPNISTERLVSALVDSFIDQGALVPTFPLHGSKSVRIYRKGENNPDWEEEISRLRFALDSLDEQDREELIAGRTRIAKINAILAFSGAVPTSLTVAPFERGSVGSLSPSVVERRGGDLTRVLRRHGWLK